MQRAVIISSRENRLDSLAAELKKRGVDAVIIERESVASLELLKTKAEQTGKIDYLIISSLCDKKYRGKNIAELSTADYKEWKYYSLVQFYEINVAFIAKMIENGGGKVLGVVSEAGSTPSRGECMNGAAGAALFMGLQCLAEESHEDGIYANAAALGAVETNSDIDPMISDDAMICHIPAKKAISSASAAERLADILMLTGPETTGNLINVDEGFSCAYMREW